MKKLVQSGHKITNIADDKDFNLLHHAVLKGQHGKVAFLIETAKLLEKPTPQQLNDWINKPTAKDAFTPMHFASYKGHLDAINVLMRNGANKNALTATGLNMLHVAA